MDEQSLFSRSYRFGEISEVVTGIFQTPRYSFCSIQLFQTGPEFPVALNNFASEIFLPPNNEIARCFSWLRRPFHHPQMFAYGIAVSLPPVSRLFLVKLKAE